MNRTTPNQKIKIALVEDHFVVAEATGVPLGGGLGGEESAENGYKSRFHLSF